MECYTTHLEGSIFFFAALYCSCLGFSALVASQRYEGWKMGIKFKRYHSIAAMKEKCVPRYKCVVYILLSTLG